MRFKAVGVEMSSRTALRSKLRRRGPAIALVVLSLSLAGCGTDGLSPGVRLSSGVMYQDLVPGDGLIVRRNDRVSIDYVMRLQGDPVTPPVDSSSAFLFTVGTGEVIRGLEQGVVGMKEHGLRRITIPARLAYGAQGEGDIIPPNATLVMDVTLRGVVNR